MSRSKRKPIIKDRPRNKKKSSIYWKRIRTNHKQSIKSYKKDDNFEDFILKNPKEIMNDYDYSDYTFFSNDIKYSRK